VLLVSIILLVATVSPAEVKVFPSKNYSVATYRTYQWLPIRVFTRQGVLEDDADVAPLIKQAVNRGLAGKGYVEVADGAELLVQTAGLGVMSSQLEGFLLTYSWDIDWGYGNPMVSPVSRVNREGTLAVALVDAKAKKGVWCGFSTEALGRPETLGKSIDKAASRLLKKLPQKK
jgi:hypothetical protein